MQALCYIKCSPYCSKNRDQQLVCSANKTPPWAFLLCNTMQLNEYPTSPHVHFFFAMSSYRLLLIHLQVKGSCSVAHSLISTSAHVHNTKLCTLETCSCTLVLPCMALFMRACLVSLITVQWCRVSLLTPFLLPLKERGRPLLLLCQNAMLAVF